MWTPVNGFEGLYEIDRQGTIRSLQKRNFNNQIATRTDRAGYRTTRLCNQGKTYVKFIHRLIAEHYIPNQENKKYVNHLNGDKLDNKIENLQWVTHAENIIHAYKNGLIKKICKSVINICTGQIFSGPKEAAIKMGINPKTLMNYLNGRNKNPTCFKYHQIG